MKRVRGHYDGSVVVLKDPAPVTGDAEVIVQFPDTETADVESDSADTRWHWRHARDVYLRFAGTVSDEILRQRGQFDVTPSGLPVVMPTDEEWQERAERTSQLLRQWQDEEPTDDLATWEELRAGLEANPVQLGEVHLDD